MSGARCRAPTSAYALGDHEMIGRSNFTNRDYEGDPTSFRAECQQGQATLPIR